MDLVKAQELLQDAILGEEVEKLRRLMLMIQAEAWFQTQQTYSCCYYFTRTEWVGDPKYDDHRATAHYNLLVSMLYAQVLSLTAAKMYQPGKVG